MSKTIEGIGIVRGGRIELIDGPELVEGQHVRVVIEAQSVSAAIPDVSSPEEGVIHTPATPELLALLEQIRKTRKPLPPSPTGPGRKSVAGCMADDPDFDDVMAEIQQYRRSNFPREVEE